ncbi:PRC-barrel domain-containing protein [Engelhardtia mirabilis]|uniref:PRC-barrel domain-containing protein n=1 Tax=Engelhardtia mirabilis TaxID=2528011 RepID=A0A518BSW5_9BACT|nr:hypothetical protein Pla133_51870 [Planctomycetes bacterium Pla133]QDV04389.1 hypothetical protein Pla86_51840 [Planctomycetes bacterium Pla86]
MQKLKRTALLTSALLASTSLTSTALTGSTVTQVTKPEEARAVTGAQVSTHRLVPLERLLGAKVFASIELERDGERAEPLAKLERMTLVARSGVLQDAILVSGGIAGLDEDERGLPLSELTWSSEQRHWVVSMTRDEFEAIEPIEHEEPTEQAEQSSETGVRAVTDPLSTADVLGHEVRAGARGPAWGPVADLFVDVETRRVRFATVKVGGVVGIGATLYPVPWAALAIEWVRDTEASTLRIVVPMTPAQLEAAPKIDADDGRTLASPTFRREVEVFFGTVPTEASS